MLQAAKGYRSGQVVQAEKIDNSVHQSEHSLHPPHPAPSPALEEEAVWRRKTKDDCDRVRDQRSHSGEVIPCLRETVAIERGLEEVKDAMPLPQQRWGGGGEGGAWETS